MQFGSKSLDIPCVLHVVVSYVVYCKDMRVSTHVFKQTDISSYAYVYKGSFCVFYQSNPQLYITETFKCGRLVWDLVEDLLNGKVSLSDPFLRLKVFETTDKKTKKHILK